MCMLLFCRRHWAEAALCATGLIAIVILCSFPFSPNLAAAKSIDSFPDDCSPEQIRTRANHVRALIQQHGVNAVPAVMRDVPSEGPHHFETVLALSKLGLPGVPSLVEAMEDPHREVRL